ncbi:MAG: AtpZ/AtpI family protein [Sphingomonadaceae bacterium]
MGTDDFGQDEADREDPRITSLNKRLDAAKRDEAVRSGKVGAGQGKGYSQGNRVLSQLIGGPAGGALIGWLLDRLFGTAPVLLLVLMALGVVVAFRNIIRISGERPE